MQKIIALLFAILMVPSLALGEQSMKDSSMRLLADESDKKQEKQEDESGLQSMQEGSMEEVTGQSGITMAFDDIKLYTNIQGAWYSDPDGTENGGGASLGIKELSAMIDINAVYRKDGNFKSPGRGVQGDLSGYTGGDFLFKPMTIDVTNALPVLSDAAGQNVAGVRVGLPSVEIHASAVSIDLAVHDDANPLDGSGETKSFGNIEIGETTMVITGGSLEIAPH